MENNNYHLILFAKYPEYGFVKKRLANQIGLLKAYNFYRNLFKVNLRTLSNSSNWVCWLSIANRKFSRSKIPSQYQDYSNWKLINQCNGDIDKRMMHSISKIPNGRIVLVGCDIPKIKKSQISTAFNKLKTNDIVFGPANDGGFWLFGINKKSYVNIENIQSIFDLVSWSTDNTLSDVLKNCLGYRVAMVDQMADIDDSDSYEQIIKI